MSDLSSIKKTTPVYLLFFVHLMKDYIVPGISIYFIGAIPLYKSLDFPFWAIFWLTITVIIALILFKVWASQSKGYTFRPLSDFSQYTIIGFCCLASFAGYASGVNGFRYSNESIAASGTFLKIFFSLSYFSCQFLFLYYFFYDHDTLKKHSLHNYIKKGGLITALLFGINGLYTAVLSFLIAITLFFPRLLLPIFFKEKTTFGALIKRLVFMSTFFIFLIAYIPTVLKIGAYVKYGSTVEMDSIDVDKHIELSFAIGRISPHYYSLLHNLDFGAFSINFTDMANNLNEPLKSFFFRFDTLTGGFFNLQKPDYGSVSRINLELIADYSYNEREGTAPGLFGGFFLVFPFPLNFLFAGLFTLWFLKIMYRFFYPVKLQLTFLGFVLVEFFTSIYTFSPIDFLTVFDEAFIMLIVLMIFQYVCIKPVKTNPAMPLEHPEIAT